MSEADEFEVIWEDPPPTGKYGNRLDRFVSILKGDPGKWGELPPMPDGSYYPISVATTLRRAYGDRIEYTTRATGTPNRNRVWARWLGESDDPEQNARAGLRPVSSE